ncbi:uncharacterized protein cubi_00355 [Cryptosporidium ubiquitum]|uniref:Uncharacterized protein n=1 Tax=Cryptosporidium ubiquitum TaxID=857276 RepID=A0A1J4MKK8_9CRYT|nr:uncharacterized protein cubi_00355 [Cryptosporidium ubiquitum]OII74802.1 hypothetical protein cubi_00355 [Cryptosporidium ubiquitum]
MSDSEESWHSFFETETLEDVFKKKILEYDPKLGLNISKKIRIRSLELIDTLVLPLNKIAKDEISMISFPMLRVIRRVVVIYSDSVHHLAGLIKTIQDSENLILFQVSELEIIRNGTIEDYETENNGGSENIVKEVVQNFKTPIERLRLKNMDLSIIEFLKLFQLEEFSKFERLDLEDCEFEGIKRTRIYENKLKISVNSVKEFHCIRTDPIFASFCPNLKKVIYEANFPMQDYVYNSFQKYNDAEKGIGIEFFELRVPKNEISEIQFLENFFIGNFPDLENLKEFRIIGNSTNNKKYMAKGRCEILKQLKGINVGYIRKNVFPMLKVLQLRNLYISLDTFDQILFMFSLINNTRHSIQNDNIEDNNYINNYQQVFANYDLKFEDGSSRNHNYNINKYQGMSIQEESDFMLSSDYASLGFSHPDDIGGKNKNEYEPLSMRFKDKGIYNCDSSNTYGNHNVNYNNNSKECDHIHEKSYINYKIQNQTLSQHEPQVMQPFLDIRSWIIRVSKSNEVHQNKINGIQYPFNSGALILDKQLEEMKFQNITEIHRNLISNTILEYLVDPLKTNLSISNSKIILSLGFDNLIYSGYMLGVLFEYQKTVKELSALSFLIPIDFFCQLELNQIQVLKVSLFKDKNLEPRNLINLCSWIEKYGGNIKYIHIRVTGTSSKWVPKETEIIRLVNIWKKMCPKLRKAKDQDQVKFECCFADNIFSKMNNLSMDFEFDTDSD